MKLSIPILILCTVCTALGGAERTEQWIVAGQSNAVGTGKLPGADPSERVRVYDPRTQSWVKAQEPVRLVVAVGVSPWLTAAKGVSEAEKSIIRIAGAAFGGKVKHVVLPISGIHSLLAERGDSSKSS
jgi:hypothetical protein